MPTADSTRLESVNRILRGSGYATTNDLTSARQDVLQADQILGEVDRDYQSQGWYFNIRVDVTLTPNDDDEIVLTPDIFRIDSTERPNPRARAGTGERLDFLKIGNRVFDRLNETFTFTTSVQVDLIKFLDFDCTPETFRHFISAHAALEFFDSRHDDPGRRRRLEIIEARALVTLFEEEATVADHNMFDNPDVSQATQHRAFLPRS